MLHLRLFRSVTLVSLSSMHLYVCLRLQCHFFAQKDKIFVEDLKAIRHSIMSALELLAASMGLGKPYGNTDRVCEYLEWSIDHTLFQNPSRIT